MSKAKPITAEAAADRAPDDGPGSVRGIRRLVATGMIAAPSFFRHRGTQLAAAISYRVLFSLVPFLALSLSVLDLVLTAEAEKNIDEWLAGLAPGNANLEASIVRTLSNTGTAASVTGLIALAGLLWTASGMAASVRLALAVVWEEGQPRPYLRAKLLDLVLVFFGVGLLLAAFVANVTLQLVTSYGTEIADRLGLKRFDGQALGTLGQTATTLALTIVALIVLYRLAPTAPPIRELLPGAIVGGIGVHLADPRVLGLRRRDGRVRGDLRRARRALRLPVPRLPRRVGNRVRRGGRPRVARSRAPPRRGGRAAAVGPRTRRRRRARAVQLAARSVALGEPTAIALGLAAHGSAVRPGVALSLIDEGVIMAVGPVDVYIIGFPGNKFSGRIVPAIMDLTDSGTIRVLDLLFVMKDADGVVTTIEAADIDEEGTAFLAIDVTQPGALGDEDAEEVADDLPANSSALLIAYENLWVGKVVEALREADAVLIDSIRIPADVVEAFEAS